MKAWYKATETTISNCFKKARFSSDSFTNELTYELNKLNELSDRANILNGNEFLNIDKDLISSELLSDEQIVD